MFLTSDPRQRSGQHLHPLPQGSARVSAPVQPACCGWAPFPGLPEPQQAASPPPPRAGMREGPLSGAVAPKHRLVLETALLLQCLLCISQDALVSMEATAGPVTTVGVLPLSFPAARGGALPPKPRPHPPHHALPCWLCSAFCFLTCRPGGRAWGAPSLLGCRPRPRGDLPGPFIFGACN